MDFVDEDAQDIPVHVDDLAQENAFHILAEQKMQVMILYGRGQGKTWVAQNHPFQDKWLWMRLSPREATEGIEKKIRDLLGKGKRIILECNELRDLPNFSPEIRSAPVYFGSNVFESKSDSDSEDSD